MPPTKPRLPPRPQLQHTEPQQQQQEQEQEHGETHGEHDSLIPPPGPEPEPEPSRGPRQLASSFSSIAQHVANGQHEMEGQLAWTRPRNRRRRVEVAGRDTQSLVHVMTHGEELRWCVAVDSFDIRVRISVTSQHQAATERTVVAESLCTADAVAEGSYVAAAAGNIHLSIELDNSYSKLRSKLVSVTLCEVRWFKLGGGQLVALRRRDGEQIARLPLLELEVDNGAARDRCFDVVLREDGRSSGDPETVAGVNTLQAASKSERAAWQTAISLAAQVLTVTQHGAATVLQKSMRRVLIARGLNAAGGAPRRQSSRRRNAHFSPWTQSVELMLLEAPHCVQTFANETLFTFGLEDSHVVSGRWWQPPAPELKPGIVTAWGSYGRLGARVTGLTAALLYRGVYDLVLIVSRPAVGKSTTLGVLYPRGSVLSLEQTYAELKAVDIDEMTFQDLHLSWTETGEGKLPASWRLCNLSDRELVNNQTQHDLLSNGEPDLVVEELYEAQGFRPRRKPQWDGAHLEHHFPEGRQVRLEVWSDAEGRAISVGAGQSCLDVMKAQSVQRLPRGWVWMGDEEWTVDTSASRHAEGWQFSRRGRVLGISWHAEEFFGAVLRRRKWVRTRRKSKQEKQRGQAQPLASPFLNSRKFLFVCKVVGEDGQPLTVWRPETPPNYLSLGDCISLGLDPPTNPAVVVDTSKLTSIRPIYQRHWVQRATNFDLVWTNEQVYFWRPLVPYVPDRFLRGKQLHPLGCVCTLSDSPPDVESVAVIHEEYLAPANDISDFNADHWTSAWVLNQKSAISKLPDDEVEDVCFFINMKTNLVYMKMSVEWLDEAETMELWSIPQPSAWRLKQRVMPAKEMNDVARSSRYAPHLKVLMNSDTRSRAHGELTTCSALVTDGDSFGLELMTASGATLRSFNVSTGECEHELHFHSEAISCMASSGLTVFSAGGSMLIGSFEGRQLPGARFQHSSAITCVHCCAVSSVDVAIVSGTDQSDGQVRCWMGTQAPGSSTLGDFRRVAMPAIGQHEHTVRACTVWPRVSVPMIPVAFRYFRMQVALMPKAVTLKNLCIVDVSGEVIQPSRVIDLTSGKPTDLARTGASVDWEIRDRVIGSLSSSFVRCATAVVEFQFALPVRNTAVHWSMDSPKKDKGNGIETSSDEQGTSGPAVSKTPRGAPQVQWKIFASDDWVHWLELKGSEVAPESIVTSGDDLTADQVTLPRKQHTVVRTKAFALKAPKDAAVVVAPFAPTAMQHLPMIVSASDDVIRIWTVSNSTVSGAKGACVGEMACDIGKISSCTVLRDGSVVTGSDTGIVQIWTPSTNVCSTLRVFSGVTALNTVYSDTSCNNLVQERRALLPGCDPQSCLRYTFRHGGPTSDKFMVPRLNGPAMAEAESVEFDGLVWMVTSCRNLLSSRNGGKGVCIEGTINGTVYSLSVRDAKVILVPGRSQCAWGISFQEDSAEPRAHITTMGGPAPGSISIWSAYVVQSSELKLYTKPGIDSELAIVLKKGTQIQAVGKQTRSGGRMWQEFVTGGESDADGWLPVSDPKAKPSSLIEGVLAPIKTLTPTVRIRYLGSSGQAAQYLGVGVKLDDGIKLVSGDVAMECGLFQLEEAAPPASLLCGCTDGRVQIWDRPNSYSRWRERATTAMPRHAGAVKELHVLQRPIRNGSAAGFDSYSSGETLLISCSHETGEDNDQTIGVWRLQQQETPACVCRLHPLIVDDCIAGMVKYVDHGNDGDFEMTLADESSALLTAHDMLLVKAQYEGLFASLIKTLTLEPVIDNRIAVRSTNRRLSGDDSFMREERGNSPAYMYWIQASNCETGIPVTFVPEERLQMADIVAMQLGASKHTIVRDATLPPDMIGGMFEVENHNESTGFLNVRELSSDVTFANRLPSDFVAPSFWESYQPPCLSAWSLLYFLLPLQYDTMQEFLTMRALRSSQQETMPPNITAATTVAEAEWSQLLTRAVSGVPMEACIIPLPNAAGPYTGSRMQWRRLIGLGVEDRDPADLSLLHACVDYCDSHPEENYEIFALDVCDVIVQFKWCVAVTPCHASCTN
jgi:WD40 repeat protein